MGRDIFAGDFIIGRAVLAIATPSPEFPPALAKGKVATAARNLFHDAVPIQPLKIMAVTALPPSKKLVSK